MHACAHAVQVPWHERERVWHGKFKAPPAGPEARGRLTTAVRPPLLRGRLALL